MAQLFKNNIFGVLQSGVSNSATSMTLTDASGFPAPTGGDHYLVTLVGFGGNGSENAWEIIKVTAKASNTLTVVRAQEGTTAVSWPGATQVQMRLTAGSLDTKVDKISGKGLSTEDYSTAEKSKLAAVAAGATANATNAELRDRTTHTGTQAIATVAGLQSVLDGKEAAGSAAASVVAHVAASDPHSQYTTAAEAAAAAPVQSVAGRSGVVVLTKSDVGLGSVDNTSDAGKPVSTAQQTALNLKANIASPTFTGTVGGITKAMVGLGSVDNTADSAKPVSTAQQTALNLKANLAGPALTGVPTAATAAQGTNTTQLATTAFVNAEIAADAAPISHVGAGGAAHANAVAAGAAGFMTGADKTKLDGIATGATANATNAELRNRTTHTGEQAISTVTGLQTTLDAKIAATGGVVSGLTLNDGYTEEVFAVTGTPALSPTNGSIQTWTLSGNSTPTAGTWASGQSMTLMVDDGSARTINWASMSITWKTGYGTAPTLLTSGYTVIELVKVGGTIYGWLAGDA